MTPNKKELIKREATNDATTPSPHPRRASGIAMEAIRPQCKADHRNGLTRVLIEVKTRPRMGEIASVGNISEFKRAASICSGGAPPESSNDAVM